VQSQGGVDMCICEMGVHGPIASSNSRTVIGSSDSAVREIAACLCALAVGGQGEGQSRLRSRARVAKRQ